MNLSLSLLFIVIVTFQLGCRTPEVELTNERDPDIVLVNIGEVDRAEIAKMLLKIDSFKPKLIAVDVWFVKEKDSLLDSKLVDALKAIDKDILSYAFEPSGKLVKSHDKFRSHALDDGLAVIEVVDGLSQEFIPIRKVGNAIHEHFALKILRHWKPGFQCKVKPNKSIPVKFTRTLEQFMRVEGVDINRDMVENIFKDKIVMLGYIGPTNEDKHFTPIRLVKNYPEKEPDTYGVVTIANAIRTLLDYEMK